MPMEQGVKSIVPSSDQGSILAGATKDLDGHGDITHDPVKYREARELNQVPEESLATEAGHSCSEEKVLPADETTLAEEQDLEIVEAADTLPTEESVLSKGGHPPDVTKLEPESKKYKAATNLISGVDFDSCLEGRGGTLIKLNQIPGCDVSQQWAGSARLDNQGDIMHNTVKYARLAVQIEKKTHAQANVEIRVEFGVRRIRNALVRSLSTAKVEWLHRPVKGAPELESAVAQAIQETPGANGFAVIITNDYDNSLSNLRALEGIHTDGEAMNKTFRELNFAIHLERNANKAKLDDIVRQTVAYFQSNPPPNPEHFKGIVFVFSGHGAEDGVLLMQDGSVVHLEDDIIKPVVGIHKAIPKFFFVDACRGSRPAVAVGPMNYMVSYATMPEHQAFLQLDSDGDTFLQALAKGLLDPDSVQNIVDNVTKKLYYQSNKLQQPERHCIRLLGPVYLNGKPPESLDPAVNGSLVSCGSSDSALQLPSLCESDLNSIFEALYLLKYVEVDRAQPGPAASHRRKARPASISGIPGSSSTSPVLVETFQPPDVYSSPASQLDAEVKMDCKLDATDFPPLNNIRDTAWVFGSRFTSLIADGVAADKLSYGKIVRSAFHYIKRFANWPESKVKALMDLMKPSSSLQDDRSHSTTLLTTVVGAISTEFDKNPALFSNWLSSLYGKLRLSEDGTRLLSLFCWLVEKRARVATTSFDCLLAQGTSLQSISYSEDMKVSLFLRRQENGILQLHGSYKVPKDVIFSKSDHDKLANDQNCCDQVATLFGANRVVLIGFDWSPLMWDPHLDLVERMGCPGRCGGYGASHYILVSSEHMHCRAYSDIKGVVPWPYTGDLLSYLEQWWTVLVEYEAQVRKGKRHRLEDEDDELACAMQTKKVKTHASIPDLKDSHEEMVMSLLDCCIQEDFDECELYDIAEQVEIASIHRLAVDLHGNSNQFEVIRSQEQHPVKQVFRVLKFWFDDCIPGPNNRKRLVREMCKLRQFGLAKDIAMRKYRFLP